MKKLDIGYDGYSYEIGKLSLYMSKGLDGKIQVGIRFNEDANLVALIDECSDKIGIDIDTDLTDILTDGETVTIIDDDKVLPFVKSCLNNGIDLTNERSITDIIDEKDIAE